MQIGIAYGSRNLDGGVEFRTPEGKLQEESRLSKTKAVLFPLTLRYILSKPDKRLQLFGSASFIPAYGTTNVKNTIKQDDITTSTNSTSASGLNAFITGGLGLNYHIGKRFDGFGELIFFNKNLKIETSTYAFRYISLGVGVNYNLY